MTEQKENSAVVEESGEAVNITPQPESNQPATAEKKITAEKPASF